MGRDEKTPPTGTAIPRPRIVRDGGKSVLDPTRTVPIVDFTKLPSSAPPPPDRESPPPRKPTLEDIYQLIDERLTPEIITRISSIPPPESRPSKAVQAAKTTGRWTKWAMALIGVLACAGEIWADVERVRGPLSQLLVFAAKQMDAHEAPELAPPEPQ